tara:strand:+ start:193 stop:387 length:195 start_codon:yes stop_codon:yes gene_type:complete
VGANWAYFVFMNYLLRILSVLTLAGLFGCTAIKTEHHITLDHTITIKIEKEVDDFLDDLYEDEE